MLIASSKLARLYQQACSAAGIVKVERVEALAEYGITLKILGTVQAVDQWAAGGELRKRLLAAFARNNIEIPRPQRVVLARDPDGSRRVAEIAVLVRDGSGLVLAKTALSFPRGGGTLEHPAVDLLARRLRR